MVNLVFHDTECINCKHKHHLVIGTSTDKKGTIKGILAKTVACHNADCECSFFQTGVVTDG